MTTVRQRRPLAAVTLLSLLATVAAPLPGSAQGQGGGVTLEQIMAHPDWMGTPPESPYWADDGRTVYYQRKREGSEERDLYRLDLATGKSEIVPDAQLGAIDAPGGDFSRDYRWKTWSRAGDIYLKDLQAGSIRQITRTAAEETDPFFMAGDNRVAFRQEDTWLVYDLASGLISQAADVRLEKDPAEEKKEEERSYLEMQQPRLFDVIREREARSKAQREEDRAEQKADPTRAPLPFYLGEEIEIRETSLSPSGDHLLIVTGPKRDEPEPSLMADFVTPSGNVEAREVRTKVGPGRPLGHQVILLDLRAHERHDLDLAALPGIKDDPFAELRKKKDGKDSKGGKEKEKKEPEARDVEVRELAWSEDGKRLALQLRALDNKDRWIATVNLDRHDLTTHQRLTDKAWVNDDFSDIGWLPDNNTLFFLSEQTGYSHLYLLTMPAGRVRQLTRGDYEVSVPVPARDGRTIYYTANAEHPGKYETWRVDVASGKAEQLTRMGGLIAAVLSPDEKQLLITHSSLTRHDELFLQPAQPGAEPRKLTDTHSQAFLAQDWNVPEIVPIPSSHVKAPIYSRVYTPKDFDPGRKYPAVVFTHGAGYLQNSHFGWTYYFREFMFHTLLTQRGYVVLDMDYRASAGYGRDWRTAIYRQMGHPEVEDLEDGVRWLVAHRGVDPKRVGTYGGSYGGFLTFMSLFRKPDLFAAGAALRPVTDWAHYNHEYTSNILNTPDVDPEAYEKSSPIEFAAGLDKPLLICTGMQDDNVFFQDSVRLVQRLIELKKENFETAIYPVEPHSFREPESWLDEYRRIFKLFEANLR